jgi:hypothetical protein
MATETLRPNAAGDETSINTQSPDSTYHWDKVDDETPDELSTCVYNFHNASYQRDLYNLPAHSVGSGTINSITVYFRCRYYNVSGKAEPSLKSGSSVVDGTEVALTTSWTTYSQTWTTNPATGLAWTWDAIDALQIGVALKSGTSSGSQQAVCTQVYVEVDYTALTAKTSSDTGVGVDAVESLGTPQIKSSSDAGSGVDAANSLQTLMAKSSSDAGSGLEALIARLLAGKESGGAVEAAAVDTQGLLRDLFAGEMGEGADRLVAKIEMPTKGGGMKLWT